MMNVGRSIMTNLNNAGINDIVPFVKQSITSVYDKGCVLGQQAANTAYGVGQATATKIANVRDNMILPLVIKSKDIAYDAGVFLKGGAITLAKNTAKHIAWEVVATPCGLVKDSLGLTLGLTLKTTWGTTKIVTGLNNYKEAKALFTKYEERKTENHTLQYNKVNGDGAMYLTTKVERVRTFGYSERMEKAMVQVWRGAWKSLASAAVAHGAYSTHVKDAATLNAFEKVTSSCYSVLGTIGGTGPALLKVLESEAKISLASKAEEVVTYMENYGKETIATILLGYSTIRDLKAYYYSPTTKDVVGVPAQGNVAAVMVSVPLTRTERASNLLNTAAKVSAKVGLIYVVLNCNVLDPKPFTNTYNMFLDTATNFLDTANTSVYNFYG